MTYQAVFERADDGSVFVYVPDLPGCTSWGATLKEAHYNVREAVRLWLAVTREYDASKSNDLLQSHTFIEVVINTTKADP